MGFTLSRQTGLGFDDAVSAAREALDEQGFGILTEIHLSQKLTEKLGVDVPQQIILGACRPVLAYVALQADPSVATLMPCNVVVRMTDAGALVEAVDPDVMSRLSQDETVGRVSRDAADRLRAALESLPGQAPVITSAADHDVVQPVG